MTADERGGYIRMLVDEIAEAKKLRRRARVATLNAELRRVVLEAKAQHWATA